MKDEVKKWMKMAEDDISSAESNLKNKKYYVSAFLSNQSVEKSLKLFLINEKGLFPPVHDLVLLGKKCNLDKSLLDKCEELSKVYIEARYGVLDDVIPSEKFNKSDALGFLETAKEVLKWAKKKI